MRYSQQDQDKVKAGGKDANWSVEWKPSTGKDMGKAEPKLQSRIAEALLTLGTKPLEPFC